MKSVDCDCWANFFGRCSTRQQNPLLRSKVCQTCPYESPPRCGWEASWCIRTRLSIHPDLRWCRAWRVGCANRSAKYNNKVFPLQLPLSLELEWENHNRFPAKLGSAFAVQGTWWWNLEILLMWFSVMVGRGMRFRFRQIESECCYQTISTENHLAFGGNEWRPCGPCARKTFCGWPLLCMT